MSNNANSFVSALNADARESRSAKSTSPRIVQSSTVTSKGQTTIPKSVRDALSLKPGSSVSFEIGPDGVSMFNSKTGDDLVVAAFLDFLERDMTKNPQNILPLSEGLLKRAKDIVGDELVDLDDEIIGAVEI